MHNLKFIAFIVINLHQWWTFTSTYHIWFLYIPEDLYSRVPHLHHCDTSEEKWPLELCPLIQSTEISHCTLQILHFRYQIIGFFFNYILNLKPPSQGTKWELWSVSCSGTCTNWAVHTGLCQQIKCWINRGYLRSSYKHGYTCIF